MKSDKTAKPLRPGALPAPDAAAHLADPQVALGLGILSGLRLFDVLGASPRTMAEMYAAYDRTAATLLARAAERTASYRRHLAQTVGRASPLVLDAMPIDEVVSACMLMRPPSWFPALASSGSGWIAMWRSPQRVLRGRAKNAASIFGSSPKVGAAFHRPFRIEGHVVREPSHPLGGLGIRPVGDCLEIALLIRGALIVSCRGMVRITVPTPLPETIAVAARGRILGELVEGPLFDGRAYRIGGVTVSGGSTTITASAPTIPFDLSWIAID